jgi:integrase/ribosomal protein L40E
MQKLKTSTDKLIEKDERLAKQWANHKELLPSQKSDLKKFVEYLEDEGAVARTKSAFIGILLSFGRHLKKPFKEATEDDIRRYLRRISANGNSLNTWNNTAIKIRKFYRWLYGMEKGENPKQVAWVKCRKRKNQLPIDHFLTKDEFYQFVRTTDNSRDRAFLMTLWESSARISEILDLRIKNIEFDRYGAVLIINGKTGRRRIRLIEAVPDLQTWLNQHPFRDIPEAPIWQSTEARNSEGKLIPEGITLNSVYWMFKKYKKKSGIKKHIHPHLLRHMRATELSGILSEQELKLWEGWTPDSRMASTYIHLRGQDIDKKLLKASGIQVEEEKKTLETHLKICPRCNSKNSPLSKFCHNCGLALDLKAAKEVESAVKFADEKLSPILESLLKDKRVEEILKEKIKELKI